ncbi:MAG: GDSL-type esterase/lipase family protein, partial [Sphingobacteriales bacterium]
MDSAAQHRMYSYLALGDSYTIGESVPVYDNFPYQLVQKMRSKSIFFYAPEIVAKTGWTTDELLNGIEKTKLLPQYDLVTLLIGVNNQYQNKPFSIYQQEFPELIATAIAKAKGIK